MKKGKSVLYRQIFCRISEGVLLLLAIICTLHMAQSENQAQPPIPGVQRFIGEYSQNGGEWLPLEEDTVLSALDGDLILRGRFSLDMVQGSWLNFYRDHIGITMCVNGERIVMDSASEMLLQGMDLMPFACSRMWVNYETPQITAEDEVEIHLINPHKHGNADAYMTFLDTLCITPNNSEILEARYAPYSRGFQVMGWIAVAVALVLLGVAIGAAILQIPVAENLGGLGLISFFAGSFVLLDTISITLSSQLVVISNYGWYVTMILFAYGVGRYQVRLMRGWRRRLGGAVMAVMGLLDGTLILLSGLELALIFDLAYYWFCAQTVASLILVGCILLEMRTMQRKDWGMRLPGVLILVAMLADFSGFSSGFYSHGTCTKIVYYLFLMWNMAKAIANVIVDYNDAARTRRLERELEDSRIAVMLGQIQPHFLYNTLTSIYQLCESDPEKAQQAIGGFSRYLRKNLESLEQREPVSFEEELHHVENYLELERMRYGKRLQVIYQIGTDRFRIPALAVQTLAENAVKHGIGRKKGGGSVTISSRETTGSYVVTVTDTGVGFDPSLPPGDDRPHVGLKSTEARLRTMCGGTLVVSSVPGEGTTAVITIPKTEDNQYADNRRR